MAYQNNLIQGQQGAASVANDAAQAEMDDLPVPEDSGVSLLKKACKTLIDFYNHGGQLSSQQRLIALNASRGLFHESVYTAMYQNQQLRQALYKLLEESLGNPNSHQDIPLRAALISFVNDGQLMSDALMAAQERNQQLNQSLSSSQENSRQLLIRIQQLETELASKELEKSEADSQQLWNNWSWFIAGANHSNIISNINNSQ